MKKWKFVVTLLLSFVLGFTVHTTNAGAQSFKDVDSSKEYYEAVERLVELGAFSTKSGKFNPNGNVTRGQLAKIFANVLQLDVTNVKNPNFKDVPTTHEFYPYIAVLANEGIVSGYANGKYGVNDPVKRSHIAKFLVNGFHLPLTSTNEIFSDIDADSETGRNVYTLLYYGIASDANATFNPNGVLKRYQIALFLERTLDILPQVANEVRLDVRDIADNPDELYQGAFWSSDSEVLEVAYDEKSKELILIPLAEGQAGVLNEINEGVKYIEADVVEEEDGSFTITTNITDTLAAEYKELRRQFFYGDENFVIQDATFKQLEGPSEEITDELDHTYTGNQYYEYIFFEVNNPETKWLVTLRSTDNEYKNYIVTGVENEQSIDTTSYEVNEGNTFAFESYNSYQLASGDAAGADIVSSQPDEEGLYTHTITYSKPGQYVFNVLDGEGAPTGETLSFEVIQVGEYIGISEPIIE